MHSFASANFRECSCQAVAGGTRARSSYTSATSTSGSLPTVAKKRTFGVLSLRSLHGELHAARIPSEIAHRYSALLHSVVAGSNLMVTDRPRREAMPQSYCTELRWVSP